MAARAALVEGPDPDRVPEHDLLRQRRLRRPAGGADLLPPRRRRLGWAEAALLAGIPADPSRYDPVTNPRRRASGATSCSRRCSTRATSPTAEYANASKAKLPKRRGHPPLGRARAGAVLHQLRPAAADRPLRRGPGLRRRAARADDDRPQHPALRAAVDHEVADRRRTARRRRSSRSTRATAACSR